MDAVALVPARAGSKGVPGKNLRELGGVPLLGHAIRVAEGVEGIARTIVSTDDPTTQAVAHALGAEAPFLRPTEFATDEAPMVLVVRHALEWLNEHEGYRPDVVVLLQPTTPFRTRDDVAACLRLLESSGADSVVSVVEVPRHHHPAWQCVVLDDGRLVRQDGTPLSALPPRRQELKSTYVRNGALYAFYSRNADRENIYGAVTVPYIMDSKSSINIDTESDWKRALDYIKID